MLEIVAIRTKQVSLEMTVFGMYEIRTKELEHAITDLIDGWCHRHDYETCCFAFSAVDVSEEAQLNALTKVAELDQKEAAQNGAS